MLRPTVKALGSVCKQAGWENPALAFSESQTFWYWDFEPDVRRQARDQCRVFLRQTQELVETSLDKISPGLIQQLFE